MSLSQLNTSRTSRNVQKMTRPFNTSMAELNPNVTFETVQSELRMFMSKRSITRRTWCAFAFLTVANIMTLITSLTPGWAWRKEVNGEFATSGEYYGLYGIWYVCWDSMDGMGYRTCELYGRIKQFSNVIPYMRAVKALNILTVICGFLCFITILTYMCVPMFNNSFKVLTGYVTGSAVAGIMNVGMFVTYCAGFLVRTYRCCNPSEIQHEVLHYGMTYCFVLSCIGAAAFFGSAIAAGGELTRMKRSRRIERKIKRTPMRHYQPDEHMLIDPKTFMTFNNPTMVNVHQ